MKKPFKIVILLLLFLLLAGCGAGRPVKKPQEQASPARQQVRVDQELAARVKDAAKTVRGVRESTAVVINKEISAAVKVGGLDRFRLKSIREEVHKKLSDLNSGYEVHVTSDKKLFNELQKIERQMGGAKTGPPDSLQKKFDKINRDMQG
jgi:predicted small lipoprotein YifL